MPPPLAGGDLRFGVGEFARLVERAGDRQRGEARILAPQRVDRDRDELVDIADIVGEQHEMLEMLGRRSGIMPQPRQAEIGARPVEQGERARLVGRADPDAVGDLVAEMDELVGREEARQFGGADVADLDAAILDHISVRDFARGAADRDRGVIVAAEMLELLDQIVAEQPRPRDAARIGAGLGQPGEGAGRRGRGNLPRIVDPELGIGEGARLRAPGSGGVRSWT